MKAIIQNRKTGRIWKICIPKLAIFSILKNKYHVVILKKFQRN